MRKERDFGKKLTEMQFERPRGSENLDEPFPSFHFISLPSFELLYSIPVALDNFSVCWIEWMGHWVSAVLLSKHWNLVDRGFFFKVFFCPFTLKDFWSKIKKSLVEKLKLRWSMILKCTQNELIHWGYWHQEKKRPWKILGKNDNRTNDILEPFLPVSDRSCLSAYTLLRFPLFSHFCPLRVDWLESGTAELMLSLITTVQ